MTDIREFERKLESAEAAGVLAAVYGADAGREASRYLGLAEAVLDDLKAEGLRAEELRAYSAPGRTELGGNHTDHNRGRVLCASVGLDAAACAAPRDDGLISIVSEGYPEAIRVELSALAPRAAEAGSTAALVRGVAKGISDRAAAAQRSARGFTARVASRVLPGSGLSSSAAFEVLVGTILADMTGIDLSPVEIARIGQFAENEYFGKPCGLMDQTASAVGGVVAIDFADPSAPIVEGIAYDFGAKGYDLVIVNTGGSHADLTPEYAAVPAEMKAAAELLGASYLRELDPALIVSRGPEIRRACGDRAFLRAMHFASENVRVGLMVAALRSDDMAAYLGLVRESGRSSWELLQNLYPSGAKKEQGLPVALSLTEALLGSDGACRVHGGGFAGTIQAYVPVARKSEYAGLMEKYFGAGSVIPAALRSKGAVRIAL